MTDDLSIARAWLTTLVFGGGLPTDTGTLSSVTSPITVNGTSDCKKIAFSSTSSEPRVWYPTSPNGDLVLIHQGHGIGYGSLNCNSIIQLLITEGFTVCGFVMIGGTATVGGDTATHSSSPIRQHLLPIIGAINTLAGSFTNIHMTGHSGGGWATTLAAAMDTRIKKSYPTSGSLPLYMPMTGAAGLRDFEQTLPGVASAISYLDMYLLGACGTGRRQKQILYDGDPCCFSKADYDEVSKPYSVFMANLATACGGDYDLVFKVHNVHEWDSTIFTDEVLAEI